MIFRMHQNLVCLTITFCPVPCVQASVKRAQIKIESRANFVNKRARFPKNKAIFKNTLHTSESAQLNESVQ